METEYCACGNELNTFWELAEGECSTCSLEDLTETEYYALVAEGYYAEGYYS